MTDLKSGGYVAAAMNALRVGIAGSGMIGSIHARAARLAGATLAGVAAGSPESAAEAARRLGAARAFDSAQALVADPEIDVIHVCVPNRLHLPLALAALEAGKDVVCEKPVGIGRAEALELAHAVAASGRVLTVPFVYRFYPTVREARARIAADRLGPLHLFEGAYLQGWLARRGDTNWRVDAHEGGPSRAFADIGSHWCDLVEFVTGHRIVELAARTHVAVPHRRGVAVGTEDIALVQFATDRGAVGSVVVSQVSHGPKNRLRFRVDGADGSVAFDQEQPETLLVGQADGSLMAVQRDPALLSPAAAPYSVLPAGHPQGFHECFERFVAETYHWIATGERPDGLPTGADGARATTLTEAVLKAARERAWVSVAPAEELATSTNGASTVAPPTALMTHRHGTRGGL